MRAVAADRGRGDHPRSRGVYDRDTCPAPASSGSSPLARGLPLAVTGRHLAWRIIPARAGFTSAISGRITVLEDHPRSRGVYWRGGDRRSGGRGSSPLARGLLPDRDSMAPTLGIIPARAGFTRGGLFSGRSARDHPRSRGVYTCSSGSSWASAGSSPLARGLPDLPDSARAGSRIIPARAGFTPSRRSHSR